MNRILAEHGRENFIQKWFEYKGYAEEWQDYKKRYLQNA